MSRTKTKGMWVTSTRSAGSVWARRREMRAGPTARKRSVVEFRRDYYQGKTNDARAWDRLRRDNCDLLDMFLPATTLYEALMEREAC